MLNLNLPLWVCEKCLHKLDVLAKNVKDSGILVDFRDHYLTQQEGYGSTLHWGRKLHFTPKALFARISGEIQ